ncbi:MAG TPA: lamin tail domain-containing protein [Thermomonas sp.]|nr:lamin tail domain-containing protein [Thermomonas sp.]
MTRLAWRRCALAVSVSLALVAGTAQAVSPDLVVSQVYGANSSTNAYNQDYVEIFNRGSTAVSLTGKTIQYASAAGTGNFAVAATLPNVTLQPGKYFLVGLASTAGGTSLPTVDHAGGGTNMSGTAGKVIIANATGSIGCNGGSTLCTPAQAGLIIDLVGYGITANYYEGSGPAAAPSNTNATFRNNSGCADSDVNSADFTAAAAAPRNTATAAAACSGPSTPTLSIADVSQSEGNAGTSILTFTVSLGAPAPAGGVTFDIATADGTALAGSDYVARSLTGQSIAAGGTSYSFAVTINGDTAVEGNEGFLVNVSNIVGATVDDASGLGTIVNDDATALTIHAIQGNGSESPYDGDTVVTTGVVTIKKNNGFFMQTPDAQVDADPATSEGILVFTGGAPSVEVGDLVEVTGTVDEYKPVATTYPVTELLPSNILKTGTAVLPAPIALTAAQFAAPLVEPDVLEHLEGMYVQIASGKIVAPTRSASTEFEVVVAGVTRPIREAGISIFDPFVVPPDKVDMPYFDANQERIKLRPVSGSTPLVDARGSVSGIVGALDYAGASSAVNSWQVWYDPSQGEIVGGAPQAVADAGADDVTIAGFNLEWFFVNASDGQSGTEAQRRTKITAVVCDWLKTPDILATSEVDDLTSLQDLASEINAGCASAPLYEARMLDTDVGNQQRLGFLISKRLVAGTTPRVELVEIQQHNETTLLKDANGNPVAGEELNDRPPLRLKSVVHFADGRDYPVTVIAVHQKSLIAVDSTDPGRNGYPTEGARNRAKRGQQAVELAQLVDDIQSGTIGGNTNEKVVLVGDFNSFDVNDGYVDVMGITTGNPAPATAVIHWEDSPLSVANGGIPLIAGNELIEDVEERYSYIFNNITQSLDHAVINQALLYDPSITDIAVDHARVNADFRPSLKSVYYPTYNTTTQPPLASSDHDPVRVSISLAADASAPEISYTLNPAAPNGSNGWYTGNVLVDWTAIDPDTTITSSTGCNDNTLSSDTTGATYTCTATSAGGTNSVTTTTIKRDATAPTLAPTVPSPLLRGQSYVASPNASDATSGVASSSCGALDTSTTGGKSTTCTATDNAGNVATVTLNYSVSTTCVNDGYKGVQLTWCQEICEKGNTGATLQTWIHRWINRYRDLPYCLVSPPPAQVPTLH